MVTGHQRTTTYIDDIDVIKATATFRKFQFQRMYLFTQHSTDQLHIN